MSLLCTLMLQLFADTFLQILDSKHFNGIKFCILFWVQSNLMIFIVVSLTNKYLCKLIFVVLEQIAEILRYIIFASYMYMHS